MADPLLQIKNIRVERDNIEILNLPELEVGHGEILAIIGPNGAGKSTLMMAISGLIPIQGGEIRFSGHCVKPYEDLAFRRRLALVMQDPLLLHTTVYKNIASGLKFRRVNSRESKDRIQHWLEKFGIAGLKDRPAHKLSGGEAQRVSLARAFVLQPDLMLLDEPFSALDAPTRNQLLTDLKDRLSETQITTLFITHDLDEALALSDRVAIIMDGRLRQIGSAHEIFSYPVDPDVARFTGVEMIIPGKVIDQNDGMVDVDCNHTILQAISTALPETKVFLCLRPEDIALSLPEGGGKTSARNSLKSKITMLVPQGPLVRVIMDGPIHITALVTRSSALEMHLVIGQEIQSSFKTSAIHVIQQ
jgi:molybdopterin-binding protein